MTFRTVTRSVPILAIFAMLPMALLASNDGGQGELEKEGAQLITQLEESARDIRFHAERLDFVHEEHADLEMGSCPSPGTDQGCGQRRAAASFGPVDRNPAAIAGLEAAQH